MDDRITIIKIQHLSVYVELYYIDYDKYYHNLLKEAIKYGMQPKDFWCGEMDDFYAYQEAYIEKLHDESHLIGCYSFVAFQTALHNAFRKPSDKPLEYPRESFYNKDKENITPSTKSGLKSFNQSQEQKQEVLENKFRNKMLMFY